MNKIKKEQFKNKLLANLKDQILERKNKLEEMERLNTQTLENLQDELDELELQRDAISKIKL